MQAPLLSVCLGVFGRVFACLFVCLPFVLLQHSQAVSAAGKKAVRPPHHAVIEPRVEAAAVGGIQVVSGASARAASRANSRKATSAGGSKLKRLNPPRLGEAVELRVMDASGREQVIKGHRLRGPRQAKVPAGSANPRSDAQRPHSATRVIRMQVQ